MNNKIFIMFLFLFSVSINQAIAQSELFYPFILSENIDSSGLSFIYSETKRQYKEIIKDTEFKLIAINRINVNHTVYIMTSDKLNALVSKERYGGFAVTIKLSIVNKKNKIEVSYTNPSYISQLYHFKKNDLSNYSKLMKNEFGFIKYFGQGKTKHNLKKHLTMKGNYKSFLPIANGKSRAFLVKSIKKMIKDTSQYSILYNIRLKNKRQTVMGLKMNSNYSTSLNDSQLLSESDLSQHSGASSLPVEIVIDGHKPIVIEPLLRHSLFLSMENKYTDMSSGYIKLFNVLTNSKPRNIVKN